MKTDFNDFASRKWTFLARNVVRDLTTSINHFQIRLNEEKEKLTKTSDGKESRVGRKVIAERMRDISHWLDLLEFANSGAEVVNHFGRYLVVLDAEMAKMRLQMKYTGRENVWLKSELYIMYKMLMILEKSVMQAEDDKKVFQCFFNMRNPTKTRATKTYIRRIKRDMDEEADSEDDADSEPEEDIPQDMMAMFNIVIQLLAEKKFVVASAWCTKSVTDFKTKYGDWSKEVGVIYNLLGRIYKRSEEYILARKYLEHALQIRQRLDGPDSDSVAVTKTLLGSTLGRLHHFKEALEMCKEALEIRQRIYGTQNEEVAHLHKKVADFSFHLKMWKNCVSHYKISVAFFDEWCYSTDLMMIHSLTNMAHAYLETESPGLALDCLRKVNVAYVRKNNPGATRVDTTPMALIEEFIHRDINTFPTEMMFQRFGPISGILDDHVVEVMILFFDKTGRPEIAQMLKHWETLSIKNMDRGSVSLILETQTNRRMTMFANKTVPIADKESHKMSFGESLRKRLSSSKR